MRTSRWPRGKDTIGSWRTRRRQFHWTDAPPPQHPAIISGVAANGRRACVRALDLCLCVRSSTAAQPDGGRGGWGRHFWAARAGGLRDEFKIAPLSWVGGRGAHVYERQGEAQSHLNVGIPMAVVPPGASHAGAAPFHDAVSATACGRGVFSCCDIFGRSGRLGALPRQGRHRHIQRAPASCSLWSCGLVRCMRALERWTLPGSSRMPEVHPYAHFVSPAVVNFRDYPRHVLTQQLCGHARGKNKKCGLGALP